MIAVTELDGIAWSPPAKARPDRSDLNWQEFPSTGGEGGKTSLENYRATGIGMIAKPIAIPSARITAAMMIATEMFPFLISAHSSIGVSQSNTRNKIPRPRASDIAPTTPHPIAVR
jgi:hypothetical protein